MVTFRSDTILCCSSQVGKTESTAAAVYLLACYGLYCMVISRSDRQAMKFFDRVMRYHNRLKLGVSVEKPTKHGLKLRGGGEVIALPNSPDTIRGDTEVGQLVVDEASRVSDQMWLAASRMTLTCRGSQALLSTPWGRKGFFYQQWSGLNAEDKADDVVQNRWKRHRVPWHDCPRLTREHIEKESSAFGRLFMKQEWLDCPDGDEFLAETNSVFDVRQYRDLGDETGEVPYDW